MLAKYMKKKKLTVNSPVSGSKPTWTVCSKLVGYDMFGFSLSILFPLIRTGLFFKFFFFLSSPSGSLGSGLISTGILGDESPLVIRKLQNNLLNMYQITAILLDKGTQFH